MAKRAMAVVFVFLVTLTTTAQWASNDKPSGIPAYNAAPPPNGKKLPPILPVEQLWGDNAQSPYQTRAYDIAKKIPAVLHQQPCYCYCDRMGHNSLHSCFETTHGAQCDICLQELYYTYAQTKKGKTATQIRKGIIAGEWKSMTPDQASTLN